MSRVYIMSMIVSLGICVILPIFIIALPKKKLN